MHTELDEIPRQTGMDRLHRRDFDRLAAFIESYSGIKMPPSKITMVEGRLRRRVRSTGAASLGEYCRRLFEGGTLEAEAVHLIDAVTTNKTEFFREPEHFDYLTATALPTLLEERRSASNGLKLWSAACSTGAEPYTLAMVLAEFRQTRSVSRVSILATDLCTEVLQTGAQAIYPEAAVLSVPIELRRRYMLRSRDRTRGLVRIVPGLRDWVQFARFNLMAEDYGVDRDFDVIFCRNVLIYFDKPTQQAVLRRLCRHLRPGGYLFLGHSESVAGLTLPLHVVGHTVFRRAD
ncbi:MAG: CheR family methyltransferase [Acetobacteraceae bacterium]|nr:CheR family methyltransferase [Acetobacteraceae bacterium]